MRHLSSKRKTPTRTENSTSRQKSKKSPVKKRGSGARDDADTEGETSNTFEVDSVVGSRIYQGKQQYKIHWKGYPSSKDTWELEENLNCPELVTKYIKEQEEANDDSEHIPSASKRKGSKPEGKAIKKAKDSQAHSNGEEGPSSKSIKREDTKEEIESEEEDVSVDSKRKGSKSEGKASKKAKDSQAHSNGGEGTSSKSVKKAKDEEEYEVEQIMDVSIDSKGYRSFLIRWKGYGPSDDTWEPESYLDCSRLIEEYMTSNPLVGGAKPGRLRENPQKRTEFPQLSPGTRHSKRSHSKNR